MKYIICGGSGFIGRELTELWLAAGHQLIVAGRTLPIAASSHPALSYTTWDDLAATPEIAENADALVNLAGASLSQRWSADGKRAIMQSRLETVEAAGKLIAALEHKPAVIVQASAVAIYGTSLTDTFNEDSPARIVDFLRGSQDLGIRCRCCLSGYTAYQAAYWCCARQRERSLPKDEAAL